MHDRLVVTRAKLSADRATTARGRQGRTLAIQGFTWMIRGATENERALELADEIEAANDAGDVFLALEKARAALAAVDKGRRFQKTGAQLLRAAGKAFGVAVRLGHGL